MNNILFNQVVINASSKLVPFISIAALDRQHFFPKLLEETPQADKFFAEKFGDKYVICMKAREAVIVVLQNLGLQRLFPVEHGPVTIGEHSWIGSESVIMPNVVLGRFCVVAANSFVKDSFPDFSLIGGTPAKLIRAFTKEEIILLTKN